MKVPPCFFRGLRLLVAACCCLAVVGPLDVGAQEISEEELGSVAFFNALPGDTRVFIDWAGKDIFPSGIRAGYSIGPILMTPEAITLEAKAEGYLPVSAKLGLTEGARRVLLVYAGPLEKDPDGEEQKRRLQIFSIPASEVQETRKNFEWPVVLVGMAQSAVIEVNGKKVSLQRNRTTKVGQGERFVQLTQGEKELAAVSVDSPSDNIFVVFGDDPNDLSGAVIYR